MVRGMLASLLELRPERNVRVDKSPYDGAPSKNTRESIDPAVCLRVSSACQKSLGHLFVHTSGADQTAVQPAAAAATLPLCLRKLL